MITAIAGGLALGAIGSAISGKPKIPTFKKTDQTKEHGKAIASNLQHFSKSRELADRTAQADQERLTSIIERTLPNYSQMLQGGSNAINRMLAGELPMEDQIQIMRKSAERGMSLGLSDSSAGRNLTARDLGLSRMQMVQSGLSNLNPFLSMVRNNFTINPMSTAGSFISPEQRIRNEMQQNQFAYQAATGKAISDHKHSFGNRMGQMLSGAGGMITGGGIMKMFGSTGGGGVGTPPIVPQGMMGPPAPWQSNAGQPVSYPSIRQPYSPQY